VDKSRVCIVCRQLFYAGVCGCNASKRWPNGKRGNLCWVWGCLTAQHARTCNGCDLHCTLGVTGADHRRADPVNA